MPLARRRAARTKHSTVPRTRQTPDCRHHATPAPSCLPRLPHMHANGGLPGNQSSRVARRSTTACKAVHARWSLDVRYGCKQEATSLLQEWVQTVGVRAGLTPSNTRLCTGAIGVPESRLEMEVTFPSLADWEGFLGRIAFAEHKAWSQRMQGMVVDGSPQWQVYYDVPVASATAPSASTAGAAAFGSSGTAGSGAAERPVATPTLTLASEVPLEDQLRWQQQQQQQQQAGQARSSSEPSIVAPSADDGAAADGVALDWKGEPMKINPGDKLPFKFL